MIISGLSEVDVDDLRANTEYAAGYTISSMQIQWFWRAIRSFDREQRLKLVQFVTGPSFHCSESNLCRRFLHVRVRVCFEERVLTASGV